MSERESDLTVAGKVAGRVRHVTDCSALVESEAFPTDRTPLLIPNIGVAMVADEEFIR